MKPIKYTAVIKYTNTCSMHISGNYYPAIPPRYFEPPEGSTFEVDKIIFVNNETGARFDIDDLPENIICETEVDDYITEAHNEADEAYYDSQEDY